jgi:menaquinone-dependent protoporphyrinogen oxidase
MSRVLVAYASKHGSTAEIAERIGEVIRSGGHQVEVESAGAVGELEPYDAIVLGSAVYGGRWRREARGLLRRLRAGLGERPLWLFSSGPVGEDEPDPSNRWHFPTKVRKAGESLGARDQVVFSGRVPPEPGNFMERSMLKNTPEEQRDCRDFEAIAAWAQGISGELGG